MFKGKETWNDIHLIISTRWHFEIILSRSSNLFTGTGLIGFLWLFKGVAGWECEFVCKDSNRLRILSYVRNLHQSFGFPKMCSTELIQEVLGVDKRHYYLFIGGVNWQALFLADLKFVKFSVSEQPSIFCSSRTKNLFQFNRLTEWHGIVLLVTIVIIIIRIRIMKYLMTFRMLVNHWKMIRIGNVFIKIDFRNHLSKGSAHLREVLLTLVLNDWGSGGSGNN